MMLHRANDLRTGSLLKKEDEEEDEEEDAEEDKEENEEEFSEQKKLWTVHLSSLEIGIHPDGRGRY